MQPERSRAGSLDSRREAGAAQALVLLTINTMPILTSASLVPNLPTFLRHFAYVRGAAFLVPMIITLPSLCIGLCSPLAGIVADRWNRRRLVLISLAVFTVCGMAPLLFADLRWIFAVRFGLGIAEACMLTVGNTLMGDYFSGETRKQWISYNMVMAPIMGAVIMLAAGALGNLWWRAPFMLYGIGAILFLSALLVLWEPPRRGATSPELTERTPFPWRKGAFVALGTLVTGLSFYAQNIQHGRIFVGLGLKTPFEIGLFATFSGVGTVLGAYAFRKLPSLTIQRALMLVYAIYAFSFIGLSYHPSLLIGTALDITGQIACGLAYPSLLAWALNFFTPEHRGRGVGVWSASFYGSSFISGILIAFIGQYGNDLLRSMGVIGWGCAVILVLLLVTQLSERIASRETSLTRKHV